MVNIVETEFNQHIKIEHNQRFLGKISSKTLMTDNDQQVQFYKIMINNMVENNQLSSSTLINSSRRNSNHAGK